jgi:hypothetical protein
MLKPEYYSREALSNSGIKQLMQSPEHYITWRKKEHKGSKSLRIGEMVHYILLTPEVIRDEVEVFPGKSLTTKSADKFRLLHPKKFILTQEEYDIACKVAQKVLQNNKICKFLGLPGEREKDIYVEVDGVPGKALYDFINPRMILDVKTSSEFGEYIKKADNFKKKFRLYGYHIQAAWYQRVAEIHDGIRRKVYFLVIEMEEPYCAKIMSPDQTLIDYAWYVHCRKAIDLYRDCMASKEWPGYSFEVDEIRITPHEERELQEELRRLEDLGLVV